LHGIGLSFFTPLCRSYIGGSKENCQGFKSSFSTKLQFVKKSSIDYPWNMLECDSKSISLQIVSCFPFEAIWWNWECLKLYSRKKLNWHVTWISYLISVSCIVRWGIINVSICNIYGLVHAKLYSKHKLNEWNKYS